MTLGEFRAKTKDSEDSTEISGACGEFIYDATAYGGEILLDISEPEDNGEQPGEYEDEEGDEDEDDIDEDE